MLVTHTHTRIHTHIHTYIHTYTHTYTHTCRHIHTHIHTYIHTHTKYYVNTLRYIRTVFVVFIIIYGFEFYPKRYLGLLVTHTYIHTYIHTYTHGHTHTYTHGHTHKVLRKHSSIHPYRLCGIHHHLWIRILSDTVSGSPRPESGSPRPESGSPRPESGSPRPESGSKTYPGSDTTETETKAPPWHRWSLLHWFLISFVNHGFYVFSCIFTLYALNKNN